MLLFSVIFSFGVYGYFNNNKETKTIKEVIEVEIINEENNSAKESIDEEIEEGVIENDKEQLEINEQTKEEELIELNEEPEKIVETSLTIPVNLPLPPKQRNNPDELRIGFITDLHVRSNFDRAGNRVLRPEFTSKINYFIERMNNNFVPDFIIANGDNIEGTKVNSDNGMAELSLVKRLFDRTVLKKYWVAGNHDLRSVNKKQFMQALDIDYMSKSFEVGNYKIIILDSNFAKDDKDIVPGGGYTRGHISEKQISFLEKELKNTGKKTIVFSHHPLLRNVNIRPNNGLPDNAERLQEIFSQNKTFAVFAGHIEDLFLQEINGVKYFISPGIVKNEKYQGAFSEITIKKDKMIIEMNYLKSDGTYRTIRIKEN